MASDRKKSAVSDTASGTTGLKIIVLVAGAVLMSLEIVGSRLLAPHFGNSVYVWGSLISIFLIALSIGYWLGGHLADRKPSLILLSGVCAVVAVFIFLIPIIGHPLCRTLLTWGLGEQTGPLAAAGILFLPPSLLLGMVSPFSVRITAKNVQSVGRTAGSLYALSTIGSIVGTLATTFVLIPYIGVSWILKCLGAAMVLLPLVLVFVRQQKTTGLVAPALIALLGLSAHAAPSFLLGAGRTILLDEDTPYHHISVVDVGNQERLLQFDRYIESNILLREPYPSRSEYTNYFQLAFLVKPDMGRTLFVGAGGGIGPRAFNAINPGMEIDVVDIDRRVLEIAGSYFFMPQSPKIHPVAADGRMFFRNPVGMYDCIVLDAFTVGGRIPFHLATREYFEVLRSHLAPGGVFLMNISSTLGGERSEIYKAVYRTVSDVFPHVLVFARGYGQNKNPDALRNIILLGTTGTAPVTVPQLLSAIGTYPARTYITTGMMKEMVGNCIEPPGDIGKIPLMTDEFAPIETMSF